MFKCEVLMHLKAIQDKLDSIITQLQQMAAEQEKNKVTIDELKAQVDKNSSLEESAVTLITGIAAQLAAAKTDPAAIQALADELNKSAGDLGAAITANTPAAPPAPQPPTA